LKQELEKEKKLLTEANPLKDSLKYPEDFINKIICGDCLEVMKDIPDNTIDLVVTDPPYGINYQSAWRIDTERFDFIEGDKNINSTFLKDCFRILKEDCGCYIFTRVDVYPEWLKEVEKYFKIKSVIVWDRIIHGLGDLNGSYAPLYDLIIYAVKGKPILKGNRPKNILRVQRVDSDKLLHPTQKPERLIESLIKNSSNENDIVLDTFLGSGTTAVACKKLNRKFIGIEINSEYCKIAEERLKKVPERLDNILRLIE